MIFVYLTVDCLKLHKYHSDQHDVAVQGSNNKAQYLLVCSLNIESKNWTLWQVYVACSRYGKLSISLYCKMNGGSFLGTFKPRALTKNLFTLNNITYKKLLSLIKVNVKSNLSQYFCRERSRYNSILMKHVRAIHNNNSKQFIVLLVQISVHSLSDIDKSLIINLLKIRT